MGSLAEIIDADGEQQSPLALLGDFGSSVAPSDSQPSFLADDNFSTLLRPDRNGNFTLEVKILDPELGTIFFGKNASTVSPRADLTMHVRDGRIAEATSPTATHIPLYVDDPSQWRLTDCYNDEGQRLLAERVRCDADGTIMRTLSEDFGWKPGPLYREVWTDPETRLTHIYMSSSDGSGIEGEATYHEPAGVVPETNTPEDYKNFLAAGIEEYDHLEGMTFDTEDGYTVYVDRSLRQWTDRETGEDRVSADITMIVFDPENNAFTGQFRPQGSGGQEFSYFTTVNNGLFPHRYDRLDQKLSGPSMSVGS